MAAFGRHQSFYLRHRWLSKALLELQISNDIFYKNDFESLGIGTNMMKSLRYWIEALEIVDLDSENKCHILTELGHFIEQYDFEISEQDTLALLHYQMVKNENLATVFYWYFNIYDKRLATRAQMQADFAKWVYDTYKKVVSENTLKRDIDCLVNMYTSQPNLKDTEDTTYSELSLLPLMKEENKVVMRTTNHQNVASFEMMMYLLLDATSYLTNEAGVVSLTIDDILVQPNIWGKALNMDRLACVNVREQLVERQFCQMTFTRTNNLDAITFKSMNPLTFIKQQKELNHGTI